MKRLLVLTALVIIFSGIGMSFALAASVTVTVDGRSGPWDTSLNPAYSYGTSANSLPNSNWGPTVVSSSGVTWYVTSGGGADWGNTAYTINTNTAGLPMTAGDTLTIQWLSGNVCGGASGSAWTSGANGASAWGTYSSPSTATSTPAVYIPPAQFPVIFMELMGVFVDSTGKIVGAPFVIGDGPVTMGIPDNVQLQMGFVDGWYNDNFGDLQVTVTETSPVPLPGAVWLLGSGLLGLGALRRFRKV